MKKLAIVGCTDYHENAPYNDNCFDIWTVASGLFLSGIKRIDKVFEIHRKDEYLQDTHVVIYKIEIPVYTQKKDNKIKNNLIFPINKIIEKYGEYITNSYTYMLLFAIEQGYKEIWFYGIDFETEREKTIERPNLEYWIGYFRGKGIKIEFYEKNNLLKSKCVYGIDNILKLIKPMKNRIKKLEEKKRFYEIQYHNPQNTKEKKFDILLNLYTLNGAIEILKNELSYI